MDTQEGAIEGIHRQADSGETMTKRSVNFRGSIGGKRGLTRRGLVETMKWVGMTDQEIKATVKKCSCGPTDGCELCASGYRPVVKP